jgi:hypothetical protein
MFEKLSGEKVSLLPKKCHEVVYIHVFFVEVVLVLVGKIKDNFTQIYLKLYILKK